MLMSSADYRESLRKYRPTVYVDGRQVASVADAPQMVAVPVPSTKASTPVAAD